MQAGKIAVKVHSASGFTSSPVASEPRLGSADQVYVICEILNPRQSFGRLATEPRGAGEGPEAGAEWEQELTFEVGPSEEALQLHAALYEVTPGNSGTDEFLASGSMSLAHLSDVHSQRHIRVPLVSGAGAHLADLSLDLRFFHTRNPARQRDEAGREFIDEEIASAGPANAARLINERSPHSPTAAPRPGSPRIKPPAHDPPVPEILASVRTTLGDEE